jgi:putative heme-binding domain-containing protein
MYEEMSFDRTVLVVAAGRPVEITFTNRDVTPHNLVVTAPGAYEDVGMAADQMATDPEAASRHFVPETEQVLHHTKILQLDESEKLFFTAPDKPDVYPFLCTFPGHWLRMYGALVVVPDVQAYLAANDPLPSAQTLLGIVIYDHDYDKLVRQITSLESKRSFERGQRVFSKASCISCHSMQGKGGRIGPELTEITKKYKPHEILLQIMNPSKVIDPKFAKVELIDEDGKSHFGVIIKETDDEIHLTADPLADCEPEIIKKTPDLERYPSKVSPMPEKLLERTSQEEIWDLLAYLIAGGDPDHATYQQK